MYSLDLRRPKRPELVVRAKNVYPLFIPIDNVFYEAESALFVLYRQFGIFYDVSAVCGIFLIDYPTFRIGSLIGLLPFWHYNLLVN
jgi:hypothetical protein